MGRDSEGGGGSQELSFGFSVREKGRRRDQRAEQALMPFLVSGERAGNGSTWHLCVLDGECPRSSEDRGGPGGGDGEGSVAATAPGRLQGPGPKDKGPQAHAAEGRRGSGQGAPGPGADTQPGDSHPVSRPLFRCPPPPPASLDLVGRLLGNRLPLRRVLPGPGHRAV